MGKIKYILLIKVMVFIAGITCNIIIDHQTNLNEISARIMKTQMDNNLLRKYTNSKLFLPKIFESKQGSWLNTDYYLPNLKRNISEPCRRDVTTLLNAIADANVVNKVDNIPSLNLWAWKMIDSWGKTADGFMWGNYFLVGYMEECLTVQPNDYIDFEGKYCSMAVAFSSNANKILQRNVDPINRIVQFPPMYLTPDQNFTFMYGTCMPSTCTKKELKDSLEDILLDDNHFILNIDCQTKHQKLDLDSSEIFGITFFSCIGLLLLIATIFDIYTGCSNSERLRNGPGKFLIAFSIWTNLPKIYRLQESTPKSVVACVYGVRSLSLFWVIWGHQLAFDLQYSENIASAVKLTKPFIAQTIVNADKSVDSFFMMGGMFLTIGVLTQMEKTKRFNIIYYYVHRILRILPPLAVIVCFTATITTMMASGPLREMYNSSINSGCRKGWFYDILFLSNFLMEEGLTASIDNFNGASCIGQSWYISADMQIYIIMPLIIIPIFYNRKIGLSLLGCWTVASIATPGIIVGVKDLWGGGVYGPNRDMYEYQKFVYLPPWCRIQAYLVGVWAGYIMFWNRDRTYKLTKIQIIAGWLLAMVCLCSVLYGVYPYNQIGTDVPKMSLEQTIAYNMFQRAVWSLGLAWIIIACHWGYGGFVNEILAHPCWQPIGRLSYTMFLVALPMQMLILYSRIRPSYYNHFTKFVSATGSFVLALLLGTVLSLIAESPILTIEKLILNRGTRVAPLEADNNTPSKPVDFGQNEENSEILEKQLSTASYEEEEKQSENL